MAGERRVHVVRAIAPTRIVAQENCTDGASHRLGRIAGRPVQRETVKHDAVAGRHRPAQQSIVLPVGADVRHRPERAARILGQLQNALEPTAPAMRPRDHLQTHLARHLIEREPDIAELPAVDVETRLVLMPRRNAGGAGILDEHAVGVEIDAPALDQAHCDLRHRPPLEEAAERRNPVRGSIVEEAGRRFTRLSVNLAMWTGGSPRVVGHLG